MLLRSRTQIKIPFYLTDQYKDGKVTIPAGVIYSRIEDTNTSKNQSTNSNSMEALWKKRLQLDLTPGQKLISSLKNPNKWIYQESSEVNIEYYYYYQDDPTYQIRIKQDLDDRSKIMPFSFLQTDISITWYIIDLVISGTKIFDVQGVSWMEDGILQLLRNLNLLSLLTIINLIQ